MCPVNAGVAVLANALQGVSTRGELTTSLLQKSQPVVLADFLLECLVHEVD